MTAEPRDFDIILYGATGFTGRQAAQRFAESLPPGSAWAIAGRSRERLAELAESLPQPPAQLVADGQDRDAIRALAARARVVATTAGPFAIFGDLLAEACVLAKTDYVDITGETPWVRSLIDRFHERAAADGTKIVPLCGFDSIPSDIATLLLVEALRAEGSQTGQVKGAFAARGGFNGGTLASALALAERGELRELADPLLLDPEPLRTKERRSGLRDRRAVEWDSDFEAMLAPFLMEVVNSRVVRRSHALALQAGEGYGEGFRYGESMDMGRSRYKAWGVGLGLGMFAGLSKRGWGRALIRKLAPAPGEGPSEATRTGGYTRGRWVAEGEEGRRKRAILEFRGDPGNVFTITALCAAAQLLAERRDELPGGPERGGILTPARAFGGLMAERLREAGARFEVLAEDAPFR